MSKSTSLILSRLIEIRAGVDASTWMKNLIHTGCEIGVIGEDEQRQLEQTAKAISEIPHEKEAFIKDYLSLVYIMGFMAGATKAFAEDDEKVLH